MYIRVLCKCLRCHVVVFVFCSVQVKNYNKEDVWGLLNVESSVNYLIYLNYLILDVGY